MNENIIYSLIRNFVILYKIRKQNKQNIKKENMKREPVSKQNVM